ncbi:MAG: hypothetical protein WC119_01515 [Synergistaceae bacterium]
MNIIENKDYISEIDGEKKYLRKVIFPSRIEEGDRWIEFTKPLSFECYHIDSDIAYIEFDFGMRNEIQINPEKNFILMHHKASSDEERMAFDVQFDLFHAFFHVTEDPNYTHYHWALYGMLRDRVTTGGEE